MKLFLAMTAAVLVLAPACGSNDPVETPDTKFYVDFGPSGSDSGKPGDLVETGAGNPKDSVTGTKPDAEADAHPDAASDGPSDSLSDSLSDTGKTTDTPGPADAGPDAPADTSLDAGQDGGDMPCLPDCLGKQCGNDGCGGSCGNCPAGLFCQGTVCVANPCVPDCAGKQ